MIWVGRLILPLPLVPTGWPSDPTVGPSCPIGFAGRAQGSVRADDGLAIRAAPRRAAARDHQGEK